MQQHGGSDKKKIGTAAMNESKAVTIDVPGKTVALKSKTPRRIHGALPAAVSPGEKIVIM
jgi:hypothetical protein